MSYSKKNKAFSVAEMLVVMLVLSIIILAMTPIAVKRVAKNPANPDHGSFECYYDGGTLRQKTRNELGEVISQSTPGDGGCNFVPPRGAMFFTVNAVGGGSPGAGVTAAFNELPIGTGVNGNPSDHGVDYVNDFFKHNGLIINTDSTNSVDFDSMPLYSNTDSQNPRNWLKSSGVPIRAILTSDAGDLTEGGFVHMTHNTYYYCNSSQGSPVGWPCNKEKADKCNSMTNPDFTSIQENNYDTDCFTINVNPGRDPVNGSRLMFAQNVTDGMSIRANGDNPELALGSVGCQVTNGGNGCYRGCSPTFGAKQNYSGGTCSTSNFSQGGGYLPEKKTITTSGINGLAGFEYALSECDANLNHVPWQSGDPSCTPSWIINEGPGHGQLKKHQLAWGRYIVAYQQLRKGVNFYAQSGNPGEYRTIYISKLDGRIRLVPGGPVAFNQNGPIASLPGDNSNMGQDTRLCYPAAGDSNCTSAASRMLLQAKGGKKPVTNVGETFILGRLFTLKDAGVNEVIAYTTGDDPSEEQYGDYFSVKNSSFVYPIPDATHPIPDTVGQGGSGAYTIHRLSSKSNIYKLWRVNFSTGTPSESSNAGGGATIANASYTCESGNVVGGTNTAAHRCFAGSGQGGAVVITW